MKKLRIIFMGTPTFAVPSLAALLQSEQQVVAVITAPDRPCGRGLRITPSPVKAIALAHHIPVLQPTSLKDTDFLAALRSYQADLQVVVAFRMLPQEVWSMPPLGSINLHASLLPQYRGAAPIHWAIIKGETETGLTTFLLDQTMDTGQVLLQEKEPISPSDTAGTLHDRLQHKGAALVLKTVQLMAQGTHQPKPQPKIPTKLLTKAPKLHKPDGQIDWQQDATTIRNFVRGLAPYPAAWTTWQGKTYKILATELPVPSQNALAPGAWHTDHRTYVHVGTGSTPLAITTLQPAGKRPMSVAAFLRGHRL